MAVFLMVLNALISAGTILPALGDALKALAGFFSMFGSDNEAVKLLDAADGLVMGVNANWPAVVQWGKDVYNLTDEALIALAYVRDNLIADLGVSKHAATTAAQAAVVKMKVAAAATPKP